MMADKRKMDSLSYLPDTILEHILGLIPIKFAVRTSVLSKRWKHVWCNLPSLSFDLRMDMPMKDLSFDVDGYTTMKAVSITKTLTRYTAPKLFNFHLGSKVSPTNITHVNRLIEFAISHNVENLSLEFSSSLISLESSSSFIRLGFPDFFYISSSLKQLAVDLNFAYMIIPRCGSVSWPSLHKLSLRCCTVFDQSIAMILSGCPLLESLTLHFCHKLKVLDLSKSLRLRTLDIQRNIWGLGPTHIVAPHIHFLKLINSQFPFTFVDVSSLTEARLDILFCFISILNADFVQYMVLKMLDKLQNVEKLAFGGNFLEILSLAEIHGVVFPKFKVKELTFETMIWPYVVPGIERLLQNSPDLKKLTLRATSCNDIQEKHLEKYVKSQGWDSDQCWRSKDGVFWENSSWNGESPHVTSSFIELLLKNTRTLDKMVVELDKLYFTFDFEELSLNNKNNNVTISALQKQAPYFRLEV